MEEREVDNPGEAHNPGSALGEAVGTLFESEVNRILDPIAKEYGCKYVTRGPANKRGQPTKLILKDSAGTQFQIDSVIANTKMQPLVLIESKYIRDTKHNRDKGSWVCTAHYRLRHKFPTVRKSIAILAGTWSAPSKALMESFDISLFHVSFEKIVAILREYGIDFKWKDGERHKALSAWEKWSQLNVNQYEEIARRLLSDIEPTVRESLKVTLDTTIPRNVSAVKVTIETNLGESRLYVFDSVNGTAAFIEGFNEQEVLNDENGPPLWTALTTSPVELTSTRNVPRGRRTRKAALTTPPVEPTPLWSTLDRTGKTGEEI